MSWTFCAALMNAGLFQLAPPTSALRISVSVGSVYATCENHRSPPGQPSFRLTARGW